MSASTPLRPIARRALASQSDDRLVTLIREGHEPAFEEVVRRYRGPLVGFAAAIVSADGAEDVVQASLEKAHRALLADSAEIALRPWLFAIVRNGALNVIRGEPRVGELGEAAATSAGPSEIAEQRDDLDRLVVAICALPAAQREALVKRELEGVGHGEIAAQLGTTATAVRGLIFRARVGLRDAVGAAVPLPILRALLTDAPAAGMVGGGAGAGAGAAALLSGGGAAKGGSAIAAAVIALGTGIAIDQGRRDQPVRGGDGADVVRKQTTSNEPSAAAEGTGVVRSDESSNPSVARAAEGVHSGEDGGRGSGGGGSGGGDDSPTSSDDDPDSEDAAEPEGEDASDDSSGPGSGGGGDDDSSGPSGGDNSGPGGGDDDNSGPGGGDDFEDRGGSGSGSDPSDDDHSGPGRPPEPDDPPELPEPIEPNESGGNSGPGGGEDEDHSGSGGSGSDD